MLSIGFAVLFSFIVTGLGWEALRFLDAKRKLLNGERLCVAFIIGCMPLYFLIEFVGYYRLDVVSILSIFLVCMLISVRGLRAMPWKAYFVIGRKSILEANFFSFLLVLTLLVAATTLLQGLAPPNDYDSMNYHLSLPRYDLELGYKGIPWDRNMGVMFLPSLGGNLTRIALALVDDRAAQIIHGLFSGLAAIGSAMLTLRLGYTRIVAVFAALMFLCIRCVVWEMATAETDYLLAAVLVTALLVYLVFRKGPEQRLAIMLGILLGCAVLIKLSGFVFIAALAPLYLYDLVARRVSRADVLLAIAFLLVIGPHLVKSYLVTGNPFYPMFSKLLFPETLATTQIYSTFEGVAGLFGTGRGLTDLLSAPWFMSVQPMHYFDGMVLGAPYLLIFCTFLFFTKNWRPWLPVLSIALFFYILWFYGMSQSVRYLTQIGPIFTAIASVGLVYFWNCCRNSLPLKIGFALVCSILIINQGIFVGIYTILRMPVAFGMVSKESYLDKTPNLTNSHYKTCLFLNKNLKPGEQYFSNTGSFLSYYCPQLPVVRNFFPHEAKWWLSSRKAPEMSLKEFIFRLEESNIRYIMVTTHTESRRNVSGKSITAKQDASERRFGNYLGPVLSLLQPVENDSFTAVYDAKEVIPMLKGNLIR